MKFEDSSAAHPPLGLGIARPPSLGRVNPPLFPPVSVYSVPGVLASPAQLAVLASPGACPARPCGRPLPALLFPGYPNTSSVLGS